MSGIVPLHVHEVAKDIITNGTVKDRYGHVCLVEIPAGKRQWVIDQNKAKQRGERLLPMVHPDKVKYALLTKTHFVHACKLIGDGNRTLYDKNQRRIQLLANDKEGHQIQEDGPICAIYKEGLFNDASALNALGNVDNLNANVQMPESELMAFNRASQEHIHVEEKYLQLAGSITNMVQHHAAMRKETLDRVRKNGGLAPLGEAQWGDLISFRQNVGQPFAELLHSCVFSQCTGRVRVATADYGMAGKLDKRAPLVMVALIMHQYFGNLVDAVCPHLFEPQIKQAPKMNKDAILALQAEGDFCLQVQREVVQVLERYRLPTALGAPLEEQTIKLNNARGRFIAGTGKVLKTLAGELVSQSKKAIARQESYGIPERAKAIKEFMQDKVSNLENDFRKVLLDDGLFDQQSMPACVFPLGTITHVVDTVDAAAPAKEDGNTPSKTILWRAAGEKDVSYTYEEFLAILGVQKWGDEVMAFLPLEETPEGLQDPAGADSRTPPEAEQEEPRGSGLVTRVKEEPGISVQPGASGSLGSGADSADALNAAASAAASPPARPRAAERPRDSGEGVQGAWKIVKLQALCPPESASVELQGDKKAGRAARSFQLSVSKLKRKPETFQEAKVNHLALMTVEDNNGVVFQKYEFNSLAAGFMKNATINAIMHCHGSTVATMCSDEDKGSIDKVEIHNFTAKNKAGDWELPIMLHARATVEFPKGALVLFPCASAHQLLEPTKENQLYLEKLSGQGAKDKPTINKAMLCDIAVSTESRPKKRRRTIDCAHTPWSMQARYDVYSPLLDLQGTKKRKANWESVAPFWALVRAPTTAVEPNMKLDVMTVNIPCMLAEPATKPKTFNFSSPQTTVQVPFAVNTRALKKGDLLVLPML